MAKTSGGVRGKFAPQIKAARELYSREKKEAYKKINSILSDKLTDKDYGLIARNIKFIENNPTFGVDSSLGKLINKNKRLYKSGEYSEGIMNMSSGLGGSLVKSLTENAAYRDLLPRMKEVLRKRR